MHFYLRMSVLDMWIYTVSIWSTEFKLLNVSADNIAYCQLAYFSLRVWTCCCYIFDVLWSHRLINYIDTKAKCRHLKKLTCKGTLRQLFMRVYYRLEIQSVMFGLCGSCLSEFIDWRYSQSKGYFRPSFVNWCPSNLLSGSTSPQPRSLCE